MSFDQKILEKFYELSMSKLHVLCISLFLDNYFLLFQLFPFTLVEVRISVYCMDKPIPLDETYQFLLTYYK